MTLPGLLPWSMVFLSLAAVLAAAGWWFVTWPERTAAQFMGAVQNQDWNTAVTERPSMVRGSSYVWVRRFTVTRNVVRIEELEFYID